MSKYPSLIGNWVACLKGSTAQGRQIETVAVPLAFPSVACLFFVLAYEDEIVHFSAL